MPKERLTRRINISAKVEMRIMLRATPPQHCNLSTNVDSSCQSFFWHLSEPAAPSRPSSGHGCTAGLGGAGGLAKLASAGPALPVQAEDRSASDHHAIVGLLL